MNAPIVFARRVMMALVSDHAKADTDRRARIKLVAFVGRSNLDRLEIADREILLLVIGADRTRGRISD